MLEKSLARRRAAAEPSRRGRFALGSADFGEASDRLGAALVLEALDDIDAGYERIQ